MKAVISLVPFGLQPGIYHIRKQEGGKVFYAHEVRTMKPAETSDPQMDALYQRREDTGRPIADFHEYWAPLEPVLQGGMGMTHMVGASASSYKPTHGGYPCGA